MTASTSPPAPRGQSVAEQPATVAACKQDRASAQGPAAARNQLALARTPRTAR